MRLVIQTTDEQNGYIENVLDVDININYLQNVQSHQKIMNNGKSKYVLMKEVINRACNNGDNNSDQNIYVSMARIYFNDKCHNGNFGDSSQLTNWILDSVRNFNVFIRIFYRTWNKI